MVSDLNIFAQKWSKIAASKKVFVYGFFYLFTFEVPFKCLFAPTSQSWMSKTFKDSKSLGKSIGKKWSQIWTFLIKNGLKSPRRKKKFLQKKFLIFSLLRYCLNVFVPPFLEVECPNFLEIQNSWGKVLKRSGLRFEQFCSKMV